MNNHKFLCALAITMMVGASCCVPVCAQQRMSLQSFFDLADQQSQRIKVSEVALKAAEEGVASAKSALLPSVELSVQGSYTGNAFLLSRGFSTSGTTEYIVPGLGPQQVQNGKQQLKDAFGTGEVSITLSLGNSTGIISASANKAKSNGIYAINGQKLAEVPTKGMYIENGVKRAK